MCVSNASACPAIGFLFRGAMSVYVIDLYYLSSLPHVQTSSIGCVDLYCPTTKFFLHPTPVLDCRMVSIDLIVKYNI